MPQNPRQVVFFTPSAAFLLLQSEACMGHLTSQIEGAFPSSSTRKRQNTGQVPAEQQACHARLTSEVKVWPALPQRVEEEG